MSSLKMTFSLASLVVLFTIGLVFVTTPVLAHDIVAGEDTDLHAQGTSNGDGHIHPSVLSIVADPDTMDQMRNTYKVLITFSHPVTFSTVQWQARGDSPTKFVGVGATGVDGDATGKKYTAVIDFSRASGVSSLGVKVAAATAILNDQTDTLNNGQGNLESIVYDLDDLPKVAPGYTVGVAVKEK